MYVKKRGKGSVVEIERVVYVNDIAQLCEREKSVKVKERSQ